MEKKDLIKLVIINGWITNILLIAILFTLVFGFCYLSDQVKTINTVTVDVRDLADY